MLHDRQPEAGATRGAGAVGAVEALEQARQVGLVDAGAVVDDANHDASRLTLHGERRVRAWAGVADRVLGEVARDHAHHPGPHLGGRGGVALDVERHSGPRGRLLELRHHLLEHGQNRLGPEGHDARARLELGQEEHLVDQLADLIDLAARLLDELGDVLPRQARRARAGRAGERAASAARERPRR